MPSTKSQTGLISKRLLECLGLMMVGDGLMAFVEPRRHIQLWRQGPEPWQNMMEPFVEKPRFTRWVGAAEAALGFWLASRQKSSSQSIR